METITEPSATEPTISPGNPHVLWRQITGLVLWVGVFCYLAGGILVALIALTLGGVTFADAWVSGIYKDAARKSFLNISPMAWGIVMPLLLVVAYPTYLLNRNRLRTKKAGNALFVAVIVLGGIVLVLSILNVLASRGLAGWMI